MLSVQLARLRRFRAMPPSDRHAILRRKKDLALSVVLLGWCGDLLNRANQFAYLSYVPDSIREYHAIPGFRGIVTRWSRGNSRRNAGDVPRLLALLHNSEQLLNENVPGDFAELGVHKGHSAQVLADVLSRVQPQRKLYLFDTFTGFDERDLAGVDASVPQIYGDTSLNAVRSRVGHDDLCAYYSGYFPDSAAEIDSTARFALVHLDCDLHEPTAAALEFFYPRLNPGGLVLIHDYSSGHWPGVATAIFRRTC
jgi:hypothetical protein